MSVLVRVQEGRTHQAQVRRSAQHGAEFYTTQAQGNLIHTNKLGGGVKEEASHMAAAKDKRREHITFVRHIEAV